MLWVGVLAAAGCQTYDFEPQPTVAIAQTVKKVYVGAKPLKPALMLVVDKSGSMLTPVSGGVTRMDALKSAMGTFLTQDGSAAHLGMLPFPATESPKNSCAAGRLSDLSTLGVPMDEGDEDDARLSQEAQRVKAAIDALPAEGGTPTAMTMRALTTYQPLLARDRTNFAVLLTDGLPNCNDENAPVASTCSCTQAGLMQCQVPENGRTQNLCLDDQGSSREISLLAGKGVRTIVIGFGTDVANPEGAATLAQMATAGGFTRPCTTNADCNAGDTCSPGGVDPCGRPASTCGQNFFQAGNASELGRVLQAIRDSVTCPSCLQVLAARPSSPDLISVIIDDVPTQPGANTWTYRDSATAPGIEFAGELCRRLMESTTVDPVRVEIRTVEAL
jgi:hypothetical protein